MAKTFYSIYIDPQGKELPYGHFHTCSLPQYGWFHATRREKRREWHHFFRADAPEHLLVLPKDAFWLQSILPDSTFAYTDFSTDFSGLWSLADNHPVLAARYKRVFPFTPAPGVYAVLTGDGCLQHRAAGDELVADFGPVDIRDGGVLAEEHPLLVSAEVPGSRERFYCIDMLTGERCSPSFRYVGILSEGLRFVQDAAGENYFVNEKWERVLNFTHEEPYRRMWYGALDPVRDKLACVDGCIPVEAGDGTSFLMNREGELIIPPGSYRNIHCLGEGRLYLVRAGRGHRGALADANGRELTPFHFCSETLFEPWNRFREKRLCLLKKVQRKERYGCINPKGEEVIPFEHEDMIDGFADGVGTMVVRIT